MWRAWRSASATPVRAWPRKFWLMFLSLFTPPSGDGAPASASVSAMPMFEVTAETCASTASLDEEPRSRSRCRCGTKKYRTRKKRRRRSWDRGLGAPGSRPFFWALTWDQQLKRRAETQVGKVVMPYSVLVVDDEELTLRTISRGLRAEGYEVFTAGAGEDAGEGFEEQSPELILLDIVLPGIDGVEVLRRMKSANPASIVLMMSAYHMVDRAVEAMKAGAYDYLVKPFHLADLMTTLQRAGEMLSLRVRVRGDVERAKGQYDFGRVVTQNPPMRSMLEMAKKAAESDHTTILILGESGTGKGVLARAIHYASPRANMPLLELNCAALPENLLESELFGFEPGAFTDARRRKEGLLERAHSGTLFLDEIGNMAAAVQAKLLRVLEEGTFMRLGGTRTITIDVRLIAATNTELKEAVAKGQFREDLY